MDTKPDSSSDNNHYWHPIASSTDLTPRHVFHGQLLGRELAVWRADDGNVNVWENRCLHRGVRLSIGVNDGRELVCQYHGWRYANRTAGCTYIPAHPADSPARTICNNRYPVTEQYGLIWSAESALPATHNSASVPDIDPGFLNGSITAPVADGDLNTATIRALNTEREIDAGRLLVLRPIPVNATIDIVSTVLQSYGYIHPLSNTPVHCAVEARDTYRHTTQVTPLTANDCIASNANPPAELIQLHFIIQPVDSARSVIRGFMSGSSTIEHPTTWLQLHNAALSQLRIVAEQQMQAIIPPAAWEVSITPVSESLAKMPGISNAAATTQRVVVRAITDTAKDIKSVEMAAITGDLATWQPGSHIDVLLANGLTRQYSLTNGPGQTDHYNIGVKLEAESSGGSSFIHHSLKPGDVLTVSPPRNNFSLRRDAVKTLLIAGGIGITPLLSMAKALFHSDLPFELHYFVADNSHVAFKSCLDEFGKAANIVTGLDPTETNSRLQQLLAHYENAHHVYLCGPGPMLDSAKAIAEAHSWPDESVHFEYFKNATEVSQDKPFSVALARTGITLQVPAGETLLSVLRNNAVALPSSCEQGACGTCIVDVIDGTPLHQDVYLSNAEKKRGNCMMTCVSRALSDSLTLDI